LRRHVGQRLQVFYLIGRQTSSLAGAKTSQVDLAKPRADQVADGVPQPREHPPDLPVPPLANRYFDRRPRPAALHDADARPLRLPFRQVHAVDQPLHVGRGHRPGDGGPVRLRYLEPRVCEAVRQSAVVRHHQQAPGVGVESAHGEQPATAFRYQVDGAGPTGRVGVRADNPFGLIENPIFVGLRPERPTVQADVLRLRVGLHAAFGDDLAVDGHAAVRDEVFASAARPDAGPR